jgi:hypothetical protein
VAVALFVISIPAAFQKVCEGKDLNLLDEI